MKNDKKRCGGRKTRKSRIRDELRKRAGKLQKHEKEKCEATSKLKRHAERNGKQLGLKPNESNFPRS